MWPFCSERSTRFKLGAWPSRASLVLSLVALSTGLAATPALGTKVVLLAGGPSHGYGAHEYAAGTDLLAEDLRRAGIGLDVVVHAGGWPEDPSVLTGVDAIVLFMDGGDAHPARDHRAEIEQHLARGVGLMAMHYAVEVPKGEDGAAFQRWIGGYYETDFSTNPHWRAETALENEHPISRGVSPFVALDEWYFNIRFRDGMSGVTPVLMAVPDDEARSGSTSWPRGPHAHITEASGRPEVLLWTVERSDGGRGVGFTGGHFHWNWANDDYRRLVLNAIVWAAGVQVPEGGVRVPGRTFDDLLRLEPSSVTKRLDHWLRFDPEAARREFGPCAPESEPRG